MLFLISADRVFCLSGPPKMFDPNGPPGLAKRSAWFSQAVRLNVPTEIFLQILHFVRFILGACKSWGIVNQFDWT